MTATLATRTDSAAEGRTSTSVLPEPEMPEQAVIAHYRLSDGQYGSSAEREAVYDAERAMASVVEEAGVGEVDGNESGGGEAVLRVGA
ncbi:hypothetical protein ABZ876_37215 [Streptomyces sp. NPDC046931]|uniref:hypothetical protein n=1 Tax=Streptomyces sp. NPDC046931 TaxID=3154806 RepID=UPI0033FF4F4C